MAATIASNSQEWIACQLSAAAAGARPSRTKWNYVRDRNGMMLIDPVTGFYFNPPPNAKCRWSTDNGARAPQQLTMGLLLPHRDLILWDDERLESEAAHFRRKHWDEMRTLVAPQQFEDLYEYFDSATLFASGAVNLWNLINLLANDARHNWREVEKQASSVCNDWVLDWLEVLPGAEFNRQSLIKWDNKSDILTAVTSQFDWDNDLKALDLIGQNILRECFLFHFERLTGKKPNVARFYTHAADSKPISARKPVVAAAGTPAKASPNPDEVPLPPSPTQALSTIQEESDAIKTATKPEGLTIDTGASTQIPLQTVSAPATAVPRITVEPQPAKEADDVPEKHDRKDKTEDECLTNQALADRVQTTVRQLSSQSTPGERQGSMLNTFTNNIPPHFQNQMPMHPPHMEQPQSSHPQAPPMSMPPQYMGQRDINTPVYQSNGYVPQSQRQPGRDKGNKRRHEDRRDSMNSTGSRSKVRDDPIHGPVYTLKSHKDSNTPTGQELFKSDHDAIRALKDLCTRPNQGKDIPGLGRVVQLCAGQNRKTSKMESRPKDGMAYQPKTYPKRPVATTALEEDWRSKPPAEEVIEDISSDEAAAADTSSNVSSQSARSIKVCLPNEAGSSRSRSVSPGVEEITSEKQVRKDSSEPRECAGEEGGQAERGYRKGTAELAVPVEEFRPTVAVKRVQPTEEGSNKGLTSYSKVTSELTEATESFDMNTKKNTKSQRKPKQPSTAESLVAPSGQAKTEGPQDQGRAVSVKGSPTKKPKTQHSGPATKTQNQSRLEPAKPVDGTQSKSAVEKHDGSRESSSQNDAGGSLCVKKDRSPRKPPQKSNCSDEEEPPRKQAPTDLRDVFELPADTDSNQFSPEASLFPNQKFTIDKVKRYSAMATPPTTQQSDVRHRQPSAMSFPTHDARIALPLLPPNSKLSAWASVAARGARSKSDDPFTSVKGEPQREDWLGDKGVKTPQKPSSEPTSHQTSPTPSPEKKKDRQGGRSRLNAAAKAFEPSSIPPSPTPSVVSVLSSKAIPCQVKKPSLPGQKGPIEQRFVTPAEKVIDPTTVTQPGPPAKEKKRVGPAPNRGENGGQNERTKSSNTATSTKKAARTASGATSIAPKPVDDEEFPTLAAAAAVPQRRASSAVRASVSIAGASSKSVTTAAPKTVADPRPPLTSPNNIKLGQRGDAPVQAAEKQGAGDKSKAGEDQWTTVGSSKKTSGKKNEGNNNGRTTSARSGGGATGQGTRGGRAPVGEDRKGG
ncbi:hypothetical protein UCDDA912_g06140 [Diaporthe ampelina]|uniref:Uncharacterized protein n=1 Tax=Diaporthe ampelina TaxID=1214573 RepID=A0A0G2I1C8_9PEZI|nr:hypothetical protein UCDDA912_g06140 [Diaporthe ampelina]